MKDITIEEKIKMYRMRLDEDGKGIIFPTEFETKYKEFMTNSNELALYCFMGELYDWLPELEKEGHEFDMDKKVIFVAMTYLKLQKNTLENDLKRNLNEPEVYDRTNTIKDIKKLKDFIDEEDGIHSSGTIYKQLEVLTSEILDVSVSLDDLTKREKIIETAEQMYCQNGHVYH